MDIILFKYLNSFVHVSLPLDWLGIFLAKYLGYLMILGLLTYCLWHGKNRILWRQIAMAVLAALVSRFFITEIIRWFYHRPRPYIIFSSTNIFPGLIEQREALASFPSGHAAFFFALSAVVWSCNRRLGVLYFGGAILMGIARVYAGLHWPSDVLGGAVIGILSTIIISFIPKRLNGRLFSRLSSGKDTENKTNT